MSKKLLIGTAGIIILLMAGGCQNLEDEAQKLRQQSEKAIQDTSKQVEDVKKQLIETKTQFDEKIKQAQDVADAVKKFSE